MDPPEIRHVGGALAQLAGARRILILPGLGGSGATHWQTHWERACPQFERVVQDEWDAPCALAWRERLDDVVAASLAETILVAHSLGCWLTADWAAHTRARHVVGAMLVAPPDLWQQPPLGPIGFEAIVAARLPFPSLVVASSNDPYARLARAQEFAHGWGAEFVTALPRGHLGTAANLYLWPEGVRYFAALIDAINATAAREIPPRTP